jgi:hypothetical protein
VTSRRITWEQSERAAKLIGGLTWGSWEIIWGPGRPQVLAFIALVLGLTETVKAFKAADK